MTLQNFIGVDHAVVTVRDLDIAAEAWRRMGFILSPRGAHSAPMGTGNHTIMLDADYIELLGVLTATPHNQKTRDFLARREGIDRIALRVTDAASGAAELAARGIAATGPRDFSRPVDLPGGGRTEARFRTLDWPPSGLVPELGIFACQHLTPDAVWIPELMGHPNTAIRLDRIEVLTDDPGVAATRMAGLIAHPVMTEAGCAQRVPSGNGRADIVFLTRETFMARHPGVSPEALPQGGVACLSLGVRDYAAAQTCVAASGMPALVRPERLSVLPAEGTGVVVELRPR